MEVLNKVLEKAEQGNNKIMDIKGKDGEELLTFAMMQGWQIAIRRLIQAGANIEGQVGHALFCWAAESGYKDIINDILQRLDIKKGKEMLRKASKSKETPFTMLGIKGKDLDAIVTKDEDHCLQVYYKEGKYSIKTINRKFLSATMPQRPMDTQESRLQRAASMVESGLARAATGLESFSNSLHSVMPRPFSRQSSSTEGMSNLEIATSIAASMVESGLRSAASRAATGLESFSNSLHSVMPSRSPSVFKKDPSVTNMSGLLQRATSVFETGQKRDSSRPAMSSSNSSPLFPQDRVDGLSNTEHSTNSPFPRQDSLGSSKGKGLGRLGKSFRGFSSGQRKQGDCVPTSGNQTPSPNIANRWHTEPYRSP